MFKKFMLPILIFSIVVQLLVPVGMIAYGNKAEDDLQKYGKEFKFKVNVVFIARGDISYSLIDELAVFYQDGKYGVIEEDAEGYAYFVEATARKPDGTDYIRLNAENREKIRTFSVESEDVYRHTIEEIIEESAYLVVKVYNGDFEVVNLYMDGIPAEEWIKTNL